MTRVRLALLLFAAAASLNLRSQEECRVYMTNDEDVGYTVDMSIGGQAIQVIPDTGSFTLVTFCDECNSCGERSELLHPKKLSHFSTGKHRAVQNYGSGDTLSMEAYAPIKMQCSASTENNDKVKSMTVKDQMFWMTVKADMPVLQNANFQGILGMGPPHSDMQMAQMEADDAKQQVDQLAASGEDVSRYEPIVKSLQEVAKLAKTVKPWLQHEGVHIFSVCLPMMPGSAGTLIFNDRKPIEKPALFKSIAVDSTGPYWQTALSEVKLGSEEDDDRISTSGTTAAVLDTGTSLIGAPSWFVDGIVRFVSTRIDVLGCDDLSMWPALEFKLDGVAVSLPASSYIGKVINPESLVEVPHIQSRMPHLEKDAKCTAMVFSTTYEDQTEEELTASSDQQDLGESPSWIFGLPFFRSYYTSFQLTKDSRDARRVFLAEANQECDIQDKLANAAAELRVSGTLTTPLVIDPSKLRLPPRHVARLEQRQLLRSAFSMH